MYAMADCVQKCEARACTQLDSAYIVELQAIVIRFHDLCIPTVLYQLARLHLQSDRTCDRLYTCLRPALLIILVYRDGYQHL